VIDPHAHLAPDDWLIVCYGSVRADRILVAFSFNASRLVTAWSGASMHWYVTLAHDGG